MSILSYHRAFASLKRGQEIASILAKHGFSHLLARVHMLDLVPGLGRFVTRLREPDAGLDAADGRELSPAERWRLVFEELGATFIKFGQLLATRPDLVPPGYIEELSKLQDAVEPLPAAAIKETIEQALGRPVAEIFAAFDERSIASGSIGQVHAATLRDGSPVVVKVKRPGTSRRVREDLDLLAALAALAEKYIDEVRVARPRVVVEEFARMMERELDFVGEASYTAKFGKDFADDESIAAPQVYWDYVTRDTLVLERISGTSIRDLARGAAPEIDRRELAATLGRCLMRQYFVTGFFHADPHPGNIIVRDSRHVCLIDFGEMGHLSDDLRRQLAMTIVALTQGDVDFIVDLYAGIGVFTEATNLREFKSELASLIDRYYGIPMDRLDVAGALQEALSVARSNHILLPRDFVLLGKSFVTIAGVVRGLDPAFRFDEVVRPFSREIFASLVEPGGLLKRASFFAYRVFSMFRRAPEDLRDLLDKVKGGHLRLIFRHEGLDNFVAHVEASANRLTLGIIIAAIIIGSSIVLAAGRGAMGVLALPGLGDLPISTVVAGLGFTIATGIGLLVAWGIIRGRRI